MIPYGKQDISKDDINEVVKILKSEFLTQGPQVKIFEKAISDYCNVKYSIAVNSATSALHLSCLSLGLKKDDWVWTSPITFVASANCAFYCGANVDLVDIDPKTYNICVESLEKKLKKAKEESKLPKIVIPVHLAGQSCDMKSIHALSKQYGFKIIEDASHAIGGKYKDKNVGSCSFSDITVFSFHPVKIITTGEGGVAVTNNKKLADKISLLSSHGITRDETKMTHEPDGDWYYQQIGLGFNYRMTDIQAALGTSQLKRLDEFISKRHKIAERYNSMLEDFQIELPYQFKESHSSYHLYIIRVKDSNEHKKIFNFLRNNNIWVNIHYIPIYKQPFFKNASNITYDLPNAENYYKTAISIPIFPSMTEKDQDTVVSVLRKAFKS